MSFIINKKHCNDVWKKDILRTGKKTYAGWRLGSTVLDIAMRVKHWPYIDIL